MREFSRRRADQSNTTANRSSPDMIDIAQFFFMPASMLYGRPSWHPLQERANELCDQLCQLVAVETFSYR
jgi:hypothetical protein